MPAIVARFGPEKILLSSLFVAATTYLAVPFIDQMYLLCIVCFILGLGMGCGQPLTLQLIYERAPTGRSGEAIGLRATLNNFTHIVTPLAFGALGTAIGVMGVFFANSLMLVAGGLLIRRK
jgi:sugar phosphate permease